MKTPKPLTYADTVEAGHILEGHFRNIGSPHHSAESQNWEIGTGPDLFRMSISTSSNIPRYTRNGATVTSGEVYAALMQI